MANQQQAILEPSQQLLDLKKSFLVSFWEKNPALAVRSFSTYNTMKCNTIEEVPIQSMTVPIISFGEPSIDTRF